MTAEEVIATLGLQRHPEGGWFVETWRSAGEVRAHDGRTRSAGTAIYFLLQHGDFSGWHRVRSDESWHLYAGGPLELHLHDPIGPRVVVLGNDLMAGQRPQATVPADVLQAARSLGPWTLVGCTVAPGFDFADFELIDRAELQRCWPEAPPSAQALIRDPS